MPAGLAAEQRDHGDDEFCVIQRDCIQFRVGPEAMAIGVGFALIMGAIGGLLPARMAAKKEILVALRDM